MFNVYAQKCGSKQIHNLAPFSTSLPTSAEECQKFKISPPHFKIENVTAQLITITYNENLTRKLDLRSGIFSGVKKMGMEINYSSLYVIILCTKKLLIF